MKKNILLAACFLMPLIASAQNDTLTHERDITLAEAIALARTQSVDAAVALNELKTAYWEYRTFRADLLPEVNFTGTLPNYNKSYSTYQNSDGSYSFVRNNTLGLSGALSIDQNIWFTGGKLSLASSLDYIKQLGSGGDKQFMSVPVSLELTQPIFGVNSLKWNRRIEPVRYAEAKASFISATEEVTMKTITYFFELLLAKEALATAQQNKANSDRLYEVAIAKRKMGQISENDLLQLKLNSLQGKADVTEAESTLNAKMFQLRSFLGVSESEGLNPVIPASVSGIKMDYDRVLNKALERTQGCLVNGLKPWEHTYDELCAAGTLSNGERLPLLEDFLEEVMRAGTSKLWLDVKNILVDGSSAGYTGFSARSCQLACQVIERMKARNFVEFIVTSNKTVWTLCYSAAQSAGVRAGWMGYVAPAEYQTYIDPWINIDASNIWFDGAAGSGQWGIDDYASAGVEVSVFTIDKDVDAAYYANYIDRLRAIATNYPKKLIGTFRK